ncbi:MAG TPA: AraC family transcriptional regulator, partial [Armatimonadota bacterium]|nr:AraC family transcriptional regulator [Armatimonadota bacterium]
MSRRGVQEDTPRRYLVHWGIYYRAMSTIISLPSLNIFAVEVGRECRHALPSDTAGYTESLPIPCHGRHQAMHAHLHHEVHVVLGGAGFFRLCDGTDLPVEAGQVVVIPSECPHHFQTNRYVLLLGCDIYPASFRRIVQHDEADTILRELARCKSNLAPRTTNDPHFFNTLRELFEQAAMEYGRNDRWRSNSLLLFEQLVAINVHRLMQLNEHALHADPSELRVLKVKTWMDRHYLEMLSMPELADMANLSASHFSAVFHRLTGASPKTYILHLRLNRAASLLTDTVYTISDIAGLVGFEYLANFT